MRGVCVFSQENASEEGKLLTERSRNHDSVKRLKNVNIGERQITTSFRHGDFPGSFTAAGPTCARSFSSSMTCSDA